MEVDNTTTSAKSIVIKLPVSDFRFSSSGLNPCLGYMHRRHLNAAIHPTITHMKPDTSFISHINKCTAIGLK